jgi:hypothetical protein
MEHWRWPAGVPLDRIGSVLKRMERATVFCLSGIQARHSMKLNVHTFFIAGK